MALVQGETRKFDIPFGIASNTGATIKATVTVQRNQQFVVTTVDSGNGVAQLTVIITNGPETLSISGVSKAGWQTSMTHIWWEDSALIESVSTVV